MNLGREPRRPCSCAGILGVRALWSIFDPRNTRTTILATSRRPGGGGRRGIQEARRPHRAPDAHRVVRRRAPARLVPALGRPDGLCRRRATAATRKMPDMLASRRTSPAVESMPEIPCEQRAVGYDGRLISSGPTRKMGKAYRAFGIKCSNTVRLSVMGSGSAGGSG